MTAPKRARRQCEKRSGGIYGGGHGWSVRMPLETWRDALAQMYALTEPERV